jgi:hypothetical protein
LINVEKRAKRWALPPPNTQEKKRREVKRESEKARDWGREERQTTGRKSAAGLDDGILAVNSTGYEHRTAVNLLKGQYRTIF